MTFVSFILPAYKAKFLGQAIQSILNQTYSNFELIIVDDDSPEELSKIVSTFDDPRISYYRNEKNIGGQSLVKQWNHCIQYGKGEYIVLAADDDIYHPDFLEEMIKLALKYPECDLLRTGVEKIDMNNNIIGLDGIIPEKCSVSGFIYYWKIGVTVTCIGNYMFKSHVLKSKQFIDFPFAYNSDLASTFYMAENGVASTSINLFKFRISNIHLSSSKKHLESKLNAVTQFYSWLKDFKIKETTDIYDGYYYKQISWEKLYIKCVYDYYNQVFKYLPLSDLNLVKKCTLLTPKDKIKMIIRYFMSKLF